MGLAIYQTNSIYRDKYKTFYTLKDEHRAACHYLQYWGLASLFHDIGYPFELPFEQVASYFEVAGDDRKQRPYIAYRSLEDQVKITEPVAGKIAELYDMKSQPIFETSDELFAYDLTEKLAGTYRFNHAYFSATVLFRKLFCEMQCDFQREHIDALTAILMHSSLYKFCIAHYKDKDKNIPFKAELHPLAYMLMLCDELQCWDRTAYGRNSRKELHPMGCDFDFSDDAVKAVYLYDNKESAKIKRYEEEYVNWQAGKQSDKPKLKAYSAMYEKNAKGVSDFQEDIERIVDLSEIKLTVGVEQTECVHGKNRSYLSDSNFIHLYSFAIVLNGRWDCYGEWEDAKKRGKVDDFISNSDNRKKFSESFKKLSLEYKLSNLNQAKAFARYMDEIGCFYTDKSVDFDMLERFAPDDLVKIGVLEHQRWLQEHYDMGWEYGDPEKEKRELVRQHKDMIPDFDLDQSEVSLEQAKRNYERLDNAERDKDTAPMDCMLAMLRMFDGLRIYRLR